MKMFASVLEKTLCLTPLIDRDTSFVCVIRNGAYHRLRTVLKPEHDIWILGLWYRQQHIGKPSGWTVGREAGFLVTPRNVIP